MRASAAPRPPFDWPGALKDAGLVAGVVVMLTLALVGARIQDTSGGPPLAYRFDDVVAAALIAFFGRLAIGALRAQRPVPVLAGALIFALALTGILVFGAEQ
jgi:phosphotransferase system  glucose/maltose/N-acetylglucosamine-specific IIC component